MLIFVGKSKTQFPFLPAKTKKQQKFRMKYFGNKRESIVDVQGLVTVFNFILLSFEAHRIKFQKAFAV